MIGFAAAFDWIFAAFSAVSGAKNGEASDQTCKWENGLQRCSGAISFVSASGKVTNFYNTGAGMASHNGNYYGHRVEQLERLRSGLKGPTVYLAGDSTLDNKFWFNYEPNLTAVNGYENVLEPPMMLPDIAYWLNYLEQGKDKPLRTLNAAIEEMQVADKRLKGLAPQDIFVRDNIGADDYLVVSIIGNDIAHYVATRYAKTGRLPQHDLDKYFGHLMHLAKDGVQTYIERLVSKRKPKKVIVCMIYDACWREDPDSWADFALKAGGVDGDPHDPSRKKEIQAESKCHRRVLFKYGMQRIRIDGVDVLGLPFFEILDGSIEKDYLARVEPSASGGRKLAEAILKAIHTGEVPEVRRVPDQPSWCDAPKPQWLKPKRFIIPE